MLDSWDFRLSWFRCRRHAGSGAFARDCCRCPCVKTLLCTTVGWPLSRSTSNSSSPREAFASDSRLLLQPPKGVQQVRRAENFSCYVCTTYCLSDRYVSEIVKMEIRNTIVCQLSPC